MERDSVLALLGSPSMEHWIPYRRLRKPVWEWGVSDSLAKTLSRLIDSKDALLGTLTYNYGIGSSGPYLLVLFFTEDDRLMSVTALEAT